MEASANFTSTFQVAEIDLIYKTGFNITQRPKITRAADAYELLLRNWNPGRLGFIEEFKILLLNQGNFVLGEYQVSQGGVSATAVDIRLIFNHLKANATGLILPHNHPSGQLYPSNASKRHAAHSGRGGNLPNPYFGSSNHHTRILLFLWSKR